MRAFTGARRTQSGVLEYLVHWEGDFEPGIGPDKSHCWVPAHTLRADLDPDTFARLVGALSQSKAGEPSGAARRRSRNGAVAAGVPSAPASRRRSPRHVFS